MEFSEAQFLIKNLLNRVETRGDGGKQLTGTLTDGELSALRLALTLLDQSNPVRVQDAESTSRSPVSPTLETPKPAIVGARIELDLTALTAPAPSANARLCLDFGTAMSKATFVRDEDATNPEEIHVLKLGVPSDQEEISEVMLISSVYIDNDGKLWFGKAAVDRSMVEGSDGSRQRLDNIKRRLSEEGWDEPVGRRFNPTEVPITHADMVLAYLTFMTWAVSSCLETLSYPGNLHRRFAMPCLPGEKGRETVHRLTRIVGEAQILADTFRTRMTSGIALGDFIEAKNALRHLQRNYSYVRGDITEPLGVAGSIMSWKASVDMLVMVVDVGAGTSDLSLYRVHFDPEKSENIAAEIEGSSRGLTEAGNHLDRLLIELIIKKSGITSDDPVWVNVRSALELQIRDFKESLFNDGSLFVTLMNGKEVDIELPEFLELEPVRRFGDNLRATMVDILESIDPSWVRWVKANPRRNLVVALTGGGSELPMVKPLADGVINVNGLEIPVVRALRFPAWLRAIDENLEADYPRVAVSLGGARRQIIQRGSSARITAGDVTQAPTLGGYYTKGH